MSTATLAPAAPAEDTRSYALRDSLTMLRRNIKHMQRYPSMTISIVIMPILMLLLFVYVFGGAIGTGIGAGGDRGDYINYVVPGIILMSATSGAVATAVSVCSDMTEGIVKRFRTMSISRGAILTGHVLGSVIQVFAVLVLVTGVSLAIGFRPEASPVEWVAALSLLLFLAFGMAWLSAAMGMGAKTVESASNAPLPLTFLPFLGSAVVTPESMPTALRWFAEYQPFTPINETLRGLLLGTEIGNAGWIALAWCTALALLGYFWSRAAFNREVTL
ncbi:MULTISPECIES: ABC transporter permease [unclassified Streptomyces]|uniref:ABC transporter permease n=1 Tax=unclassified Streptomyces TaxID=2593676 RepID=UPI0006F36044|nr:MULTISPECIES: ABC transporter permease [unclassified Streptomyces]KQX46131.1 ABC transporter permease [Streptomyces sp. Root1304]KRA80916.1 ABC transporter permease [Streptomyces sp. Root66D1]